MLTGGNTKDAIKIMQRYVSKDVKNAKYAAARLIRTESSYFASEGQKKCFNDLDVEKYEIVATLDNRTSDICQGMDGQVFEMKDFETGVTAPPFHVNCRSTTAPYFDDEFALGERAARGEDGKVYNLPANMNYKDWYNTFIRDNIKIEAVKEYYYANKKPIEDLIIPNKYNQKMHKNEIGVARLIQNEFGGRIELLLEDNTKSKPDYNWNNKLWELKSVSTSSSIDSQVRKGIRQIFDNPGGLILDLDNCNLKNDEILFAIKKRILAKNGEHKIKNVDIILIKEKNIYGIIRYKKK